MFTPTLLTILGVIMYLRLPWTIGNAGLLGGILIILLANGITAATGLSLSSIATNTRMGAGGPYAVISRSLGFEIGGTIGVPLYLSQALAVSMYVFGFREGWLWIFPTHPPLLVDLAIFAVIFGNVSVWTAPEVTPTMWGSYLGSPESGFSGTNFWAVFAVFFPAATGVMAGLLLRDLNLIAPLITMFFLITYMVINVVLLAESSLGLMSFRPTIQLPRVVPLIGALGCLFVMFIINPIFGLVAVGVVSGLYIWIVWHGAAPRAGTVRSSIFVAFAEWAARKVTELDLGARRAWKPQRPDAGGRSGNDSR